MVFTLSCFEKNVIGTRDSHGPPFIGNAILNLNPLHSYLMNWANFDDPTVSNDLTLFAPAYLSVS